MAEIKVIWGPSSKTCREDRLAWSFSGLRTNGEYARWHLAFWFDSRRFSTKALPGHPGDEEKAAKLAALPVATPPLSGRVTPMLRAKLKPEDIAEATRLALEFHRRHGR
ncbi:MULTISPECIES: hypothetical protein [Phyllobacteriaceae]|jgi:hypothetical protein|uniref:Uncharacterized protein n=1 Tax=Mesorhizobium hungaricum TaxID=1566387 RepID=A0A1C2DD39_9HYPH|nr:MULTISPECIES: hypothetical protein [Mesorhizobium]MBN9235127.1 hypothetical protein [Mesorhizobium sp.]OCX12674.1 hypothetical protein QV13_24055 [Mesorhizobium hungaricum]